LRHALLSVASVWFQIRLVVEPTFEATRIALKPIGLFSLVVVAPRKDAWQTTLAFSSTISRPIVQECGAGASLASVVDHRCSSTTFPDVAAALLIVDLVVVKRFVALRVIWAISDAAFSVVLRAITIAAAHCSGPSRTAKSS
jgi:hypothetical protein